MAPLCEDLETLAWRCDRTAAIADHLNKGNKVVAIISLLHMRLRDNSAVENQRLGKYNPCLSG